MIDEFIRKGLARPARKDESLIKSIIKFSGNDLEYLKKLEINNLSSRTIMTGYYDVLRNILEAIASNKGYKVYSHEFFTYLLKEMNEDLISLKFDRIRKIRNGIKYYAKDISPQETKEITEEIKNMIKELKEKYLKEF